MTFSFLNLGNLEILILLFVLVIVFTLPVIAIIKVLRNKGLSNTTKIMWILLIIFVPYLGAILYFLIGNKQPVQLFKE
jgi:uncharacterized membrane protein YhaH (DUF805 family)